MKTWNGWIGLQWSSRRPGKGKKPEGCSGEGRARRLGDLGVGGIRSAELTVVTVG